MRGVSGFTEGVARFQRQIDNAKVNLHSFLLMKEGKILTEWYRAPYGPDIQHRMYSITKSLTSIAIGLLEEEGKLALSDRICDYFPEFLFEPLHPWIKQMCIEDLLCMRTCHSQTTYKQIPTNQWVASFFQVKPEHCPGTIFSYDTSASVVLAALVEKLSQMDLMEYLRAKVFREIGVSEQAYIIKTPDGVSSGGSGLMCTTRDLARIGDLCCHFGKFHGKQLLPEEYMKKAVSRQIGTLFRSVVDEQQGYGYHFWMTRYGGFAMYGLGGQLVLCFSKEELIFVTTAYTYGKPSGIQSIYDAFYSCLFPCFGLINAEKMDYGLGIQLYKEWNIVFSENRIGWRSIKIFCQGNKGVFSYKNRRGEWKIPFTCLWDNQLDLLEIGNIDNSFFMENNVDAPALAIMYLQPKEVCLIQIEISGENPGMILLEIGAQKQEVTLRMKQFGDLQFSDYTGIVCGNIVST